MVEEVSEQRVENVRDVSPPQIVGKHVYGNLYGCAVDKLFNIRELRRVVRGAVEVANMRLVELKSWKFGGSKGGVSVLALIIESHIALHTWPQYCYATVDVYTCGDKSDPERAFEYICTCLKPGRVVKHIADRSSE